MSIVAPTSREPVNATPRGRMTPARRRAVSERQGGLCAVQGCGKAIVEIDHVRALELGAADTLDNLQGLCKPHHLLKTLTDLKAIAKARRLRKRADGTRRERKPIAAHVSPWPPAGSRKLQSRGFPK